MKRFHWLLVPICSVALLSAAIPLSRQDQATPQDKKEVEQKARALLDVTNSGSAGKQMFEAMVQQFARVPGLPEGFVAKFQEMAKIDELVDELIPVYVKHLDPAVMDAALEFFRSEAGQKFVAAQSKIMAESLTIGQHWGQRTAAKVMQTLREGK